VVLLIINVSLMHVQLFTFDTPISSSEPPYQLQQFMNE